MNSNGMRGNIEPYFKEAADWDVNRVARTERSERLAWRTGIAGWLCALTCGGALILLMPLKRVDPFVIRVDSSTGVVDVVPVYSGTAPMSELVTRYFLTHYVTVCERFNIATAESDYEECASFQTARRNQSWYALWNRSNPKSPLNLYRDGSVIRAEVQSVSFFRRTGGVSDLAQVRYMKAEYLATDSQPRMTRWIATIQFAYVAPSVDPKLRRWNPLGFKVTEFGSEPEVVEDAAPHPVTKGAAP
ncbi:MAG TPA: VirB8/TrbF family protein [Steroidobacteraceae bacterium]